MQTVLTPTTPANTASLADRYKAVRQRTQALAAPLRAEDTVVQPAEFVSPTKWHLAHTTWFFETFLLGEYAKAYKVYHPSYAYLFNSYYEAAGKRMLRANRGNVTRPGLEDILAYRSYVDLEVAEFLTKLGAAPDPKIADVLELGLQHEMQHQELLLTDIKYVLGHNPTFPVYDEDCLIDKVRPDSEQAYIGVEGGVHAIGHTGDGFCFDNELGRHQCYLSDFELARNPVSFGEYLEFIEDGGYRTARYWHADAWALVQELNWRAPLYVHKENGTWYRYTLSGFGPVNPDETAMHLSHYEAYAYAQWKGARLPTEFEWEVAADKVAWGSIWEHCASAYLAYPGFKAAPGALGEYNGKFMINQMVLRGASKATAPGHSRITYRNFFHPHLQWQFSGLRLVK